MLPLALRLFAVGCIAAGLSHVVLGPAADVMLGADLPDAALADASFDSQNRFYGTAFALYGVLCWICAGDLTRHATIVRAVMAVFFAAGAARLISIAVAGLPAPAVLVLLASELLLPPLFLWWLARTLRPG